jgi:CubicO group peptidase (beta-lactamase class C family)
MSLSRRNFLIGSGAALTGLSMPASADIAWNVVAPADAGFTPDLNARIDKLIADKRIWNVHGLIVLRGGKLVLERYFSGRDNARGRDLGEVTFKPETLHDMRSVSKSITALLYGIALANGKVPPLEAPLLSAFPEHADLMKDGRERVTMHHVLSMTMGTQWDETSIAYIDARNDEIAMDIAVERGMDRYRFILERKAVREPGRYFTYSGGATALIGKIIARGTGKTLHAFAREALFGPLGIGETEWLADKAGDEFAASGIRMAPRDMARIGQLMLNRGMWNGKTVIPANWIERCVAIQTSVDDMRRFGYQWYISYFGFGKQLGWLPERVEPAWMAQGNGGQRIYILAGIELVVAITGGNYNTEDQWMPPTRLMREAILPSVIS